MLSPLSSAVVHSLRASPNRIGRALGVLLIACCSCLQAQELQADLNEQVILVPKKGSFFTAELETTVFKPAGDGPFPVVIINHGKALGDPRFQARYRPLGPARFFLSRGYAVVVPMRQGFSKSSGAYIAGGCNVESNGRVQAEDVKAALDWLGLQTWAHPEQRLLMGQSHGGWTTLAFGASGFGSVKGLVNFAGGLRQDSCAGWEANLGRSAGQYGKETALPSLWFYGDNDSFFSPTTFRPMFEQYTAGGAKAELVAFGNFGSDAHSMFGSRAGEAIWQNKVVAFMTTLGLPTAINQPHFAQVVRMSVPPPSNFADINDAERVPYLKDTGRQGYKTFLTKQFPRAFVLAPNGAWNWTEMGDDPLKRALDACNRRTDGKCKPYAVDDVVVWAE